MRWKEALHACELEQAMTSTAAQAAKPMSRKEFLNMIDECSQHRQWYEERHQHDFHELSMDSARRA